MDTIKRIPTHPGDVLKEELECRKISQKKFSEVLGVSYTMLNEILNGKRPVTSDFALMVEAALDINAELLVNMQTRYNMAVARKESGQQVARNTQDVRHLIIVFLLFISIFAL